MTVRRRRPQPPSLQVLRDPKIEAALRRAIDEYTEESYGCECTDAATCYEEGHENALAHPKEFLDWLLRHTKPPPRPRPALAQNRRARWKRKRDSELRSRRRSDRQVAALEQVA